ncbi:MAG: glycosyltransferase family protein [Sulfobacillus sp.]
MRLVIGIYTTCADSKYLAQIAACQNTWIKEAHELNVPVVFFCGPTKPTLPIPGWGRLVHFAGINEDYASATDKQWLGLSYMAKNFSADFYLIAGSDTYVRVQKLMHTLDNEFRATAGDTGTATYEAVYVGGHDDPSWYQGEHHSGGAGIVLSRAALLEMVPRIPSYTEEFQKTCEELGYHGNKVSCDSALGILAQRLPIRMVTVPGFYGCDCRGMIGATYVCCGHKPDFDRQKIVTCHYMTPGLMYSYDEELLETESRTDKRDPQEEVLWVVPGDIKQIDVFPGPSCADFGRMVLCTTEAARNGDDEPPAHVPARDKIWVPDYRLQTLVRIALRTYPEHRRFAFLRPREMHYSLRDKLLSEVAKNFQRELTCCRAYTKEGYIASDELLTGYREDLEDTCLNADATDQEILLQAKQLYFGRYHEALSNYPGSRFGVPLPLQPLQMMLDRQNDRQLAAEYAKRMLDNPPAADEFGRAVIADRCYMALYYSGNYADCFRAFAHVKDRQLSQSLLEYLMVNSFYLYQALRDNGWKIREVSVPGPRSAQNEIQVMYTDDEELTDQCLPFDPAVPVVQPKKYRGRIPLN